MFLWRNKPTYLPTSNMKKCHLLFVVANLFLSEINVSEKCKTSFDNSNIMRTKYSTEV